MNNNRKLTAHYLKYIVKTPVFFGAYLLTFTAIFILITNTIEVERRDKYSAIVGENQIIIRHDNEIELYNNKVYAYTDKNRSVITLYVSSAEFDNGIMNLILSEEQNLLLGEITIEVIAEKSTLLSKIFTGVGGKDEY